MEGLRVFLHINPQGSYLPPHVGHTIRIERAIQLVSETLKTVQEQGQTIRCSYTCYRKQRRSIRNPYHYSIGEEV
jgi:hypothetical protein